MNAICITTIFYFFEDNSIKLSDNVNNVWIEIELLKFSFYRRGLKP